VTGERIEAVRKAWRVSATDRILLVPGRIAPWNGQLFCPTSHVP